MNILKTKKNKNTILKKITIVFFLILVSSVVLFNIYGNKTSESISILVNKKIDKVLYLYFSNLIKGDIFNNESINDILVITKNNKEEILTVNYDLEKSYALLKDISDILKEAIIDLEHGKIDVNIYDQYLENGNNNLILNVPLFINSKNVFLNNLGPKIPIIININETLLTNIKTKVTNYGFNNALLEIYVTVEMQKLIITPIKEDQETFHYDILIGALVVNGSVPEFYGGNYETNSNIYEN